MEDVESVCSGSTDDTLTPLIIGCSSSTREFYFCVPVLVSRLCVYPKVSVSLVQHLLTAYSASPVRASASSARAAAPAARRWRVQGPRTLARSGTRRQAVERPVQDLGGARGWALQPRVVYLEYGGEGGAWKPPRVPFPPLVFAPDSPCWTQTEEPGAATGGSGLGGPGEPPPGPPALCAGRLPSRPGRKREGGM